LDRGAQAWFLARLKKKIFMKNLYRNSLTALAALLCVSLLAGCGGSGNKAEDFTFTVTNKEATITGYKGVSTDVVIPARIRGMKVTTIGDGAFDLHKPKLTSVVISKPVTIIANYAFSNNKLTSVTIPNSVTGIGDMAFGNNELTSVTIPNSVISVGVSAFRDNPLYDATRAKLGGRFGKMPLD
jgi:hypothetical protein